MTNSLQVFCNSLMFCFAAIFSYTGLPVEPVLILTTFTAVDTLLGVTKSAVLKQEVTSHRLSGGVAGKVGLVLIPFVLALTAKAVGVDMLGFVTYALNVIIISEAYSIISNVYTIRTKKEAPEWDVMSILLNKIHEFADNFVGKTQEYKTKTKERSSKHPTKDE